MYNASEVTLSRLANIFIRRIVPILLITLIMASAGFAYRTFLVDDMYTSVAKLYVNTNENVDNSTIEDLNVYNYTQKVVNTYIQFLNTNTFYEKIANTLATRDIANPDYIDYSYTPGSLSGMISMSIVGETEVFRVVVTSKSPKDTLRIANTFVELAPKTVEELKNSRDTVKTVDLPSTPVVTNRNHLLLSVLYAIIAFVLSYAIFIVFDFADVRIHDEEDLGKYYTIPLLGVIPDFSIEHKKMHSKKYSDMTDLIYGDLAEIEHSKFANGGMSYVKK